MAEWKETSYGTPKSWDEIRSEQSNEEMNAGSASPFRMIALVVVLISLSVAGFIYVLYGLLS